MVDLELKHHLRVFFFSFLNYRCSQIMGRNEQDDLTAAQIFYPCMQCADIFFLKVWVSFYYIFVLASIISCIHCWLSICTNHLKLPYKFTMDLSLL